MTRTRFRTLMARAEEPQSAGRVAALLSCSVQDAAALLAGAPDHIVEDELRRTHDAGARILTLHSDDYPAGLRRHATPPPLLWVHGSLRPTDEAAVAVIGSRQATGYGRSLAQTLSSELAKSGVTIVSGMARGIDSIAHTAALQAGARTIAVLGNGLGVCYPAEHRGLMRQIAQHGALVSEYPMTTKPDPWNFLERNEIIAQWALGTLVIEAAERSGTLSTARHTLEANRFLFALPGDVTRRQSRGTNQLIRSGAILVQSAREILVDLAPHLRSIMTGWELPPEEEPEATNAAPPRTRPASRPVTAEADAAAPAPPSDSPATPTNSQSTAHTLLERLRHEPMQFDDLALWAAEHCQLTTGSLSALLLRLELAGDLHVMPGRVYRAAKH